MKKSLYIFVALVTLALGGTKVVANTDLIGICKYEFDVSGNKVTHKIGLLYYHNLVSGGEDANGNEVSSLKNTGYGTKWNFEKGFDEKIHAATYQNNTVVGCPKIRICNNQNISLDVYFNSATVCDEGTTSILASATFVPARNSNVEVEEDVKYCSTTKRVRNKSYQIKVEFFSHAGQKKYKISRNDNSSLAVEGNIDDYLTLDGNTYKIKNDVKNAYFKTGATCNPLYIQVDSSEVYTFQLVKPASTENGSFGTNEEDDDDGSAEYDDDGSYEDESEEEGEGITTTRKCISCGGAELPSALPAFSRALITTVQVLVPVVIIIMGIVTLVKAMVSGEDKAFSNAKTNLIRKVIAGVMIFLVITIVKFVFSLFGGDAKSSLACVSCFTSDENACTFVACPERNMGNTPSDSEVGPNPGNSGGGSSSSDAACNTLGISSCSSRSDCEWDGSTRTCKSKPGSSSDAACNTLGISSCNSRSDCEWDGSTRTCKSKPGSSSDAACNTLGISSCNSRSDCEWDGSTRTCKSKSGS